MRIYFLNVFWVWSEIYPISFQKSHSFISQPILQMHFSFCIFYFSKSMSPLHPLALHLPQSKSTVTQPLRWTAAAKLPPPIHGLGWTFGQRRVAPFLFNLCTFNYFQKWNQHDPDFFRWIDWLGGIIMDKWNDYKTWLYKPFVHILGSNC